MEVVPNSEFICLEGIPLDNSYQHTIYFSSRSAQESFFKSKQKKVSTALSYQRHSKGVCRIEAKMSEVHKCNYCMFKNTAFENKWFYAFITNVEYVSNETCDIYYEIDDMQTWFMVDCRFGDCYVLREHIQEDHPGWNVIPEGLEQGPYVSNGSGLVFRPQSGSRIRVCVSATFDENMGDGAGQVIDNVYTALNFMTFDSPQAVDQFIAKATENGKTDGIVSMYAVPDMFPADFEPSSVPYVTTFELAKGWDNLDTYVPRNKKLLCYPYNKLTIFTDNDAVDYRWELFQDQGATKWSARFVMNPAPAVVIYPDNYAAQPGGPMQPQYRVALSDFPQVPYVTDIYKVYMGQNQASNAVKCISAFGAATQGAVQGAKVGGVVGAVAGAAIGLFENIGGEVAARYDLQRKPPQMSGAQTSTADYAVKAKNFYWNHQCINRHFAAVLDNYFDMFGYRVLRVKQPNVNTRPHWNYVRLGMTNILGSVPADALNRIERIMQAGITFWKNGNEVGNYQLDNTVS